MSDSGTPDRRIWIDGRLVPWADATVHVLSHSHSRGSLVFDYLSVHETPRGPAIFRLPEHVQRFLRSVALVGLPLARDEAELCTASVETVAANPGANALKICAYLPSVEVDVVPLDDHVAVAIAAYDYLHDVILRKSQRPPPRPELKLHIERTRKRIEAHLPPQAKAAANYLGPMMAKWRARQRGFDEVVMVDEAGFVAEGPTTNVFAVDDHGVLRTPPAGSILEGITRGSVLELAKHAGIPAREESMRPEALQDAAEVFLTGTSAGVWPVASIDGKAVGDGKPGPITTRLRERFEAVSGGHDADFDHWLTVVRAPGSGD
ncbi:MAG: aminotransferase class IV [Myxococcota bacterium]|nr:aminotransferase class IV [Myxococcota bacterium]